MKVKNVYMTDSMATAVHRASHLEMKTQHAFITDAVLTKLKKLDDPKIDELIASHEANIVAREEEKEAKLKEKADFAQVWRDTNPKKLNKKG